jgi:hypothetical protein
MQLETYGAHRNLLVNLLESFIALLVKEVAKRLHRKYSVGRNIAFLINN